MNKKAVSVLELNKIIDILRGYAICTETKDFIDKVKPSSSKKVIDKWLDETQEAVRYILKRGNLPIKPVKNVDNYLQVAKKGGVIYNREILLVKDLIYTSRIIKNHMEKTEKLSDGGTDIEKYIDGLYTNKRLEDKINRIVVSEDEISDHASDKLYSIRSKIKSEQSKIRDKIEGMIRSPRISKYLQENVVTMRKDRYVIPVKSEYKEYVKGLIHDTSTSGQTLFIEPMSVVESNNKINELRSEETREIERILKELTDDIASCADNIYSLTRKIFKLDFVFAKANYALDIKAVRPDINQKGIINIKKARHPLIPDKEVVPIDIRLGEDFKTMVITGPNTGGKTVTLKTIGLLVLMMQSGLFIPVSEMSKISVYHEVYADIGDEQSIEQSLSTFSSHMKNIISIMDKAKKDDLVLFDELGAGTDPVEGAALAISILDNLKERLVECIATTHYSELKMYAITQDNVVNASCEFDVKSLSPTYKLLIGVPGKSNAFAIAKRLGLGNDVIKKANEYISEENMNFEKTIEELQEYKSLAQNDKQLAERYRKEAKEAKEKYVNMKKEYDLKRKDILSDARREAHDLLEKTKKEINEMIKTAKNINSTNEEVKLKNKVNSLIREERGKIHEIEFKQGDIETNKNREKEIEKGDKVIITDSNTKATVIEGPDKEGNVKLQAGIIKINSNVKKIKYIDEQKEIIKNNPIINKGNIHSNLTVKTEINVIGKTIEEATFEIDKYLDQCHLASLTQVIIIHGKGTGALRAGIQEFLRNHYHVDSFRNGEAGEGGTGVTVVKLKN